MEDIILIGGGGHCKSVIDVIEEENRFNIAGVVEKKHCSEGKILNYDVIGSDEDLDYLVKKIKYAIISVGQIYTVELRIKLFEQAKKTGFILPCIVSPRAYVSKYATIGEGTVIAHDVLINANVEIGKNCIINSKALIEHDSKVKDNCHISTGALINGGVMVGENSFVGSGAITKQNISIRENSFIKAGSVVK